MTNSSNIFPTRFLHAMLRVEDLERSIEFYTDILGMRVLRRENYEQGQFTLVFLGYEDEKDSTVLELTYNWDGSTYEKGTAYGHIALAVSDIYAVCGALEKRGVSIPRQPGPMAFDPDEIIAFIEDPDGYKIELVQRS